MIAHTAQAVPTTINLIAGREMQKTEMRKQISIFVPLSDWRAIRDEAARQHVPITELCRRWMRPGIDRIRKEADH